MNRKQKRAQAASKAPKTADEIPLSQPDRTAPKTKTLYEIAAEKQAELLPQAERLNGDVPKPSNVVNVRIGPNGEIIKQSDDGLAEENAVTTDEDAIPPLLDTAILAMSFTAVHFTLETLTVHQYAQELRFAPITRNAAFVAFPTLFLMIHLAHGHIFPLSSFFHSPRAKQFLYVAQQILYVVLANWAGCYLIQVTNDKGYYAVMKKAPGAGTLWVWSVIELGLVGALAGVIGPGVYAWRNGYGIF